MSDNTLHAVASTNPCKLCTPLGASLAFHGIEGAVCLLHGSQGCSTYIRRYLISHFKEPLDIASTNFSEHSAVFGGRNNFLTAVRNLSLQYRPSVIGVATTCLAETMGEDLSLYLHELSKDESANLPDLVTVSTAAYRGTHADGFHGAVKSLVEQLGEPGEGGEGPGVLVMAPLVSPSDLRALKDWLAAFDLPGALVPDWSETLDGGPWDDYTPLPPGGTPVKVLKTAGKARAALELGRVLAGAEATAGTVLEARGVPLYRVGWPLGVRESDRWFALLSELSGKPLPRFLKAERARLLDSLVDGHKVVSGLRVAVFGEEDLVVALCGFLAEIGAHIVAVASGGNTGRLRRALEETVEESAREGVQVLDDSDFFDLEQGLVGAEVDLLIGNSKGYKLAQARKVPLLRVGFPVHDRFGGARIRLLGYGGAQDLFDRIVNAVLEKRQADNPVGYTYY